MNEEPREGYQPEGPAPENPQPPQGGSGVERPPTDTVSPSPQPSSTAAPTEESPKKDMRKAMRPEVAGVAPLELDTRFLSRLLAGGRDAMVAVFDEEIDASFLRGNYADAFTFILDYYKQYDALPSTQIVENKTGATFLAIVPETLAFLMDELRNRAIHERISNGLGPIVHDLDFRKPLVAYEKLEKLIADVRAEKALKLGAVEIHKLNAVVVRSYELAKEGKVGIETPWPTLNLAILGWQDAELYGVFARAKRGKSWWMLAAAHHAWKRDNGVLFVSPEMTQVAIARRFTAIRDKIPYGQLRGGKLDGFNEKRILDNILAAQSGKAPFNIIAEEEDITINRVEAAIERTMPKLLFLDGVYLMDWQGRDLNDRAVNMAEALKKLVRRYKLPVVVSSQFNRTVKQSAKSAEATSIAMTDRLAWNMDMGVALLQDANLKDVNQLRVVPLVLREAPDFEELLINFNLETMDFSEVSNYYPGSTGSSSATPSGGGSAKPKGKNPTDDSDDEKEVSLFG